MKVMYILSDGGRGGGSATKVIFTNTEVHFCVKDKRETPRRLVELLTPPPRPCSDPPQSTDVKQTFYKWCVTFTTSAIDTNTQFSRMF